jgi:hypothetical protein
MLVGQMNTGILFDGHLTGSPFRWVSCSHKPMYFSMLRPSSLFDCYLTGKGGKRIIGLSLVLPEALTFKESLIVQNDENRRIAEARQADAEKIAELERIEKQFEQKKEQR